MKNPKVDATDGKTLARQERGKLAPSGPVDDFDYYDYLLGYDEDDGMHNKISVDEADKRFSPLTIILERDKTQEELLDVAQHLVKEHPELIPSAKELLEALQFDETKHAEKAMELLKNQHVLQGFVDIFDKGYAVHSTLNMLAEKVLEGRTNANRVARIRRDPFLPRCLSAKEDVLIMRGALCILVGFWIDQRLQGWLIERAYNFVPPNSQHPHPY